MRASYSDLPTELFVVMRFEVQSDVDSGLGSPRMLPGKVNIDF